MTVSRCIQKSRGCSKKEDCRFYGRQALADVLSAPHSPPYIAAFTPRLLSINTLSLCYKNDTYET